MHLLRSHRLIYVQVPQVVTNLITNLMTTKGPGNLKSVRGNTQFFIIKGSTNNVLKWNPAARYQNAFGQTNQHIASIL